MLIVISPAKNLDYETPPVTRKHTKPALLDEAELLAGQLKQLAPQDISRLMSISDKLGVLNYDRYQAWKPPFTTRNARQAVLAFNGDVYAGLNAREFSEENFAFAQEHLRILSGLYGVLRPLDLIQPYRLEMGTRLANERGGDLYAFWDNKITGLLNKQLKKLKTNTLINLASGEYFKSVNPKLLEAQIITPVFKDWKNGQYKIISFYAKKARGLMSAYIIKNGITEWKQLTGFNSGGYQYNKTMSKGNELVFTRKI